MAWRNSAVTQEFLENALSEADAFIAALVMNAGNNPPHDRYCVGRIDGLKYLAEWQPEFTTDIDLEEEDEDA